jgi:hypothetical protein
MALSDLRSREAVLSAIAEFDTIGREKFLEKYGFGPSQRYFVVHEGERYDSKAILGAAHGYQFPQDGPLAFDDFKGGDQTITALAEKLGFEISDFSETDGVIRSLALSLNEHAPDHEIGKLQFQREQRLGKRVVTKRLFSGQTIHETYAFHSGGRQELQFNIGLEDAERQVR